MGEEEGKWLPYEPVATPSTPSTPSIWALGLTFADHMKETGEHADAPVVFRKPCRPEPGATQVRVPSQSDLVQALNKLDAGLLKRLKKNRIPALLDYEVELGMVLLEDWHALTAMPQVGYILVNDVTVRSLQIAGLGAQDPLPFWSASKGMEGFLPVTDRMWCPHQPHAHVWPDVRLKTLVNGEVRQEAPLTELLYTPLQVLQRAALNAPDGHLRRHDVVLAGTPAGIALQAPAWKRKLASCLPRTWAIRATWHAQSQSTRFLQSGDVVDLQADWLGRILLTVTNSKP